MSIMEGMKLKNVDAENIQFEKIRAFTFIGDSGCDGLGAESMSIFSAALREASGDFILVGGDLVPAGKRRFYEQVAAVADAAATKPVYTLRGNHDTGDYETFFGKKNYYMYDDRLLLVVLDDSQRAFSYSALNLLQRALETCAREHIVLSFHIPPPNRFTRDSLKHNEWNKVLGIIEPHKAWVDYVLCGHIHSYFEDFVNGIKLITTGGGGAGIQRIKGIDQPYHHFVEFAFDETGNLIHKKKDVTFQRAADAPPEARTAVVV